MKVTSGVSVVRFESSCTVIVIIASAFPSAGAVVFSSCHRASDNMVFKSRIASLFRLFMHVILVMHFNRVRSVFHMFIANLKLMTSVTVCHPFRTGCRDRRYC